MDCVHIPELPKPLALTLPGGVTLEQQKLLEALQPALAPLMPLFDIIEAVVAVFDVVKAIPEMLGPPPDPTKLAAALPALGENVAKLLRLVPQVSLPYTVVGLLDVLLDTLTQARNQLVALQRRAAQLQPARQRAAELNDSALLAILGCSQANIPREAANVGAGLASLSKRVSLLNVFFGMVGAPEVPDFSSLGAKSLEEALAPIDAIVTTLQTVRRAIPLP